MDEINIRRYSPSGRGYYTSGNVIMSGDLCVFIDQFKSFDWALKYIDHLNDMRDNQTESK